MCTPTGLFPAILFALLAFPSPARAVRPFITDDARVVGARNVQVESWVELNAGAFDHWVLFSIGPTAPLEFAIGGVYGVDFSLPEYPQFTIAGPLLQAKFLFVEAKKNRWPGVAVEGGTLIPFEYSPTGPDGWRSFALVALTESLFEKERLLIHLNLGVFHAGDFTKKKVGAELLWGLGMQLRTFAGLHLVAEVFSGNSYSAAGGGATQLGLRYAVSDKILVDATVGKGIWGEPASPLWGTAGVHIVMGPWGKKRAQ